MVFFRSGAACEFEAAYRTDICQSTSDCPRDGVAESFGLEICEELNQMSSDGANHLRDRDGAV